VKKRVLVCEPDADVRQLLELTVARLGHEPVRDGDADAVLMEPACAVAHSALRRFARRVPPIVCLSIHPREDGLAPPETVAYLMKPVKQARLAAVLAGILAP
jgi:CheY-like chemotaxis protein